MTDGLPELFNKNKEMFGSENIKKRISQFNKSAKEIINDLVSAGKILSGNQHQTDDVTLIDIKLKLFSFVLPNLLLI